MNLEISNIEERSFQGRSSPDGKSTIAPPDLALSWPLIVGAFVLTSVGILEIYASSSVPALQRYGDSWSFLRKQLLAGGIGFLCIAFSHKISLSLLKKMTLPLALVSLVMLGLIFVPALQYKAGHAARWLRVFGFTFQPAELAKLSLVLFLARNLSRPNTNVQNVLSGVAPNFVAFGAFAMLIMPQPDFGTTVLLFSVTFLMVIAAGAKRSFILGAVSAASLAMGTAIAVAPYRLKRFLTFMDPFSKVREGGYQIIQSYLGFQNGGTWGLGLGESRQKLYFLPEAHTDFILAVVGEELGVFGVILVIAAFLLITNAGYTIARKQSGQYERFLAFGLTSLIAVQGSINMGVAMGMLPTKGIPLPFVSNGPTCLLVFLVITAILVRLGQNIGTELKENPPAP